MMLVLLTHRILEPSLEAFPWFQSMTWKTKPRVPETEVHEAMKMKPKLQQSTQDVRTGKLQAVHGACPKEASYGLQQAKPRE